MDDLKQFTDKAHELGIDFVPKLNFSRSGRNLHDKLLSPHWSPLNFVSVRKEYRQIATDVMKVEGGDGFLFTNWIKCSDKNKERILNQV